MHYGRRARQPFPYEVTAMTRFFAIALWFLAASALARPVPAVTGPIEATLVESVGGCKHLIIFPGVVDSCAPGSARGDELGMWTCMPRSARAALVCGTSVTRLQFDRFMIQSIQYKGRVARQFRLAGAIEGSIPTLADNAAVTLTYWFFEDQPSSLRGSIDFTDAALSKAFVAQPLR